MRGAEGRPGINILQVSMVLLCVLPFAAELAFWSAANPIRTLNASGYVLVPIFSYAPVAVALILRRSWRLSLLLGFAVSAIVVLVSEFTFLSELLFRPGRIAERAIGILIGVPAALLATRMLAKAMRGALAPLLPVGTVVLVAFSSFQLTPSRNPTNDKELPDIVFVVLDAARVDHLSVYGYRRHTTPGLTELARNAAVYENAVSPASWTVPAHASLLTGLYPSMHGADGEFLLYDPPTPSLPEILRDTGYATAAIVNNPILYGSIGWTRGFDEYVETWTHPVISFGRIWRKLQSRKPDWQWMGATDRTIRIAKRWWAGAEAPRFLFVNVIDPHSPYGEPHEFRDLYLEDAYRDAPDLGPKSAEFDAGLGHADGPGLEKLIARYDGDIRYMDHHLKRLWKWLAARGDLDSSLIVITADHGERLGERGLLGHSLGLDECLLRVPLILRFPGKIQPARIQDLAQTHSLFATILELAGVDIPEESQICLQSLMHRGDGHVFAQMRNQGIFLEQLEALNPHFDRTPFLGDFVSVSDGTWKLVRSTGDILRLAHLPTDPLELEDVAIRHPEVAHRLASLLDHLPPFERGELPNEDREELMQRLRELGYVR